MLFLGKGRNASSLKKPSWEARHTMVQDFFPARYFLAIIFFPHNQSAGYFFLKSNIPPPPPPLKRQMVGPFQSCFGLLLRPHYSRFREQTTPVFRRPQTSVFFFFHLFWSRFVKKLFMPMVVEIDRLCSLGTATALINNVTENTREQSKRGSCVWQVSHKEEERATKKSRGK